MKRLVVAVGLMIAGCSHRDAPGNDVVAESPTGDATAPLNPGARPVTIGEGGAGLNACVARARVVNLSPAGQPYLPIRAAPFTDAAEIGRLHNGDQVYACTRSIDQAWRGVVIPPATDRAADCGVSAPVAEARPYTGPCRSGWIASAFVELSAN